eukprot:TRINITY_DN7099_c0_g1_i1.p1 TRINITY_DN7099_c0_g1~~TRINITY_DN7099_c0_g1_i1.p1  ORF type:complete len:218 (-),score=44.65 TRINITY_DN7099_c0_g1_i1:111-713(-)
MSIEPPPGISCWPVDPRDLTKLQAIIEGPLETPYEGGYFQLSINISDDYPFSPPKVVFETKIYHPNIDEEGRICMDTLKPKGWLPQMNIRSILLQLQVLMQEPNPDDPLVVDISNEYQYNLELFKDKARTQTEKYAKSEKVAPLQRLNRVSAIVNCLEWKMLVVQVQQQYHIRNPTQRTILQNLKLRKIQQNLVTQAKLL